MSSKAFCFSFSKRSSSLFFFSSSLAAFSSAFFLSSVALSFAFLASSLPLITYPSLLFFKANNCFSVSLVVASPSFFTSSGSKPKSFAVPLV
jgi:hypothetical protein